MIRFAATASSAVFEMPKLDMSPAAVAKRNAERLEQDRLWEERKVNQLREQRSEHLRISRPLLKLKGRTVVDVERNITEDHWGDTNMTITLRLEDGSSIDLEPRVYGYDGERTSIRARHHD